MDDKREITLDAIEKAAAQFHRATTKIAWWQFDGLRQIAKERGVSMAAVIRAAVDGLLAKEGIERPAPRRAPQRVHIEIGAANVGILRKIVRAVIRGEG